MRFPNPINLVAALGLIVTGIYELTKAEGHRGSPDQVGAPTSRWSPRRRGSAFIAAGLLLILAGSIRLDV